MSENVIQHSFAAGELAPSLFARTDLSKYKAGAARLRNFFVDYRSGASTRGGTKFIIQCLISTSKARLIPFQYSVLETYTLEFGHQYIRFISRGGAVLETAFNLSAANNAFPGQITAPGHNFVNGDWVFIDGIVGADGWNKRFCTVTVSGNVLTCYDVNGVPIDAIDFGTYLSGGTVARVYKIPTPYAAADIPLLKFTQSASILTITHPSYAQRNLTRVAATNWTLTEITFATSISAPTGLVGTPSSAGAANYSYIVTALDENGQESLASTALAVPNSVNIGVTAGNVSLTWNAVTGAFGYNVYKAGPSISPPVPPGTLHGFIGFSFSNAFSDGNIVPDYSDAPQIAHNPFAAANYPGTCCFFEQREVYAGSASFPMTFWMSQPGAFNNFNYTHPTQPDDSIEGTLVSSQVNAIKSMVPMPGGLVVLTDKGAWQVNGGGTDTSITPINAKATPQAYNGASDVPPIVSNYDILFVQAKGSIVRDLAYSIYTNIYTGMDISVLSNHLFLNKQITEWAYAEEPFKVIWAVRDDGILLSLTFVKEQEIYGWGQSDTLGLFQSVASITEGEVDAVYVIVKRYVNGQWLQFIERMMERNFDGGSEDAWCVDCGVQSALTYPAAGIVASASTGATVTFTADAPVFDIGDVSKILRMGGGIATIIQYVSPTQLVGAFNQDIQQTLTNDMPLPQVQGDWSLTMPVNEFRGLDHLNGQTVSILADGGVVAPQEVVDGKIILDFPASKVTAGLGYLCQLQTLRIDTGDPTIQGKRKKINAITVRCSDTRGIYYGYEFSDNMTPDKELTASTPLDLPSPLITGDLWLPNDPHWDTEGQVYLQIQDPLPATILGVISEITVGDDTK